MNFNLIHSAKKKNDIVFNYKSIVQNAHWKNNKRTTRCGSNTRCSVFLYIIIIFTIVITKKKNK